MRRSAQQGFTFMRRSAVNGFTLVELMVVITLIALASATVILTLPGDEGAVRAQGEKFALKLRAARDAAVIDGRPVVMWVSRTGYGFEQWRDGRWQEWVGGASVGGQWTRGVTPSLPAERARSSVQFDATGLPDAPADIDLIAGSARVRIRVDAAGEVRING